jgi:hypothetical protein
MTPAFLIRFVRGSGHQPELRDHFLRWESGFLHACAAQTLATRYDQPNVARDVATRAERAFPGARLAVMPVIA